MLELQRRLGLQVVGADFCHPMLLHAQEKLGSGPNQSTSKLSDADAMALPFREGTFRFVTIAFGLRNVEIIEQGLKEMYRVLEPGGSCVILEFSRPVLPVFRSVFAFYFSHILPRLGAWISGNRGALPVPTRFRWPLSIPNGARRHNHVRRFRKSPIPEPYGRRRSTALGHKAGWVVADRG